MHVSIDRLAMVNGSWLVAARPVPGTLPGGWGVGGIKGGRRPQAWPGTASKVCEFENLKIDSGFRQLFNR